MTMKELYQKVIEQINYLATVDIIAEWYIDKENTIPTIVIQTWSIEDGRAFNVAKRFCDFLFECCTYSDFNNNIHILIFESPNMFTTNDFNIEIFPIQL